jgi:hypothetical protein
MIPFGAIWAAIRLLFSGVLEEVLKGLSAAAKWVFSDWRNGPLLVCAAMWAVHVFLITPHARNAWRETAAQLEASQLAHLGTISNYIDAAAKAQADAEANVARVTAEQEEITDATLAAHRSDLALLRARFDRLRAGGAGNPAGILRARDAARTDPGRADPAGLPGPGAAPGRAAGAPGDEDLRAPGNLTCPAGFVCLTIDQAQRASEDAHRHDRLIDWAIDQSLVRFAPEGSR